MKAAVLQAPGDIRVVDADDPVVLDPRDAIVHVTLSAISGVDLHHFSGSIATSRPTLLGREFVGVVVELGASVNALSRGDRVVVSAPVACGQCWFCTHQLPTQCERSLVGTSPEGLDAYFGSAYSGGHAEYVRVPFADFGARKIPADLSDEQAIFLGDLLPSALSAVDWGGVGTGDTVAVFGCGPVGLMAQKIAWLRGAERVIGIDVLPYRLEAARRLSRAETLNAAEREAVAQIHALTGDRGADVCIDAIGLSLDRERGAPPGPMASSLHTAFAALRPGGRLSGIGTYDPSSQLSLRHLFGKGACVRVGSAPVQELIDGLIELTRSGSLVSDDLITHRLALSDAARGYRLANERRENCIKVVFRPDALPQ